LVIIGALLGVRSSQGRVAGGGAPFQMELVAGVKQLRRRTALQHRDLQQVTQEDRMKTKPCVVSVTTRRAPTLSGVAARHAATSTANR
jgi:hypothetical protein